MQSILTVLALAPAVALGFGVDYDVEYSNGWSKQEQVRASLPVSFTVVVNEQGADEIVRIAKEVSNPDHPKYGKYLSAAQLNAIVAPTATDMNVRPQLPGPALQAPIAATHPILLPAPHRTCVQSPYGMAWKRSSVIHWVTGGAPTRL